MSFSLDLCILIAQGRRARLLQKLWEGDPVAWSILIGVVVLMIAWQVYKSRRAKNESGEPTDS